MLSPTVLWQKVATLFFSIHYFFLLKITAGDSPRPTVARHFLAPHLLLLSYYFLPIFPALRKGMWRTKGLYIQTIKDTVTDTRERNAYNKAERCDKIPLHGVKAQEGGTVF